MDQKPLAPEDVEASFRALRYTRALTRLGPRLTDPDYWRELNPDLSVTDEPPAARAVAYERAWAASERCHQRLRTEGYVLSPPLVPIDMVLRLRTAVERIVARGLPPGCALMYDEFYQVYAGVLSAVTPILMPEDFWVFFVPPDDGATSHWTAFPPHKDWADVDPGVMAGDLPTVLVGWVALTDVTPNDSCMYIVPGDCDRGYRTHDRVVHADDFRLQDVRAVPASAGQVLLFSTHVAHWGSRSSRWATHPRISISMFFQRADVRQRFADVLDLSQPIAVADRARWMLRTLRLMMGREQSEALMRGAGLTVPSA